MVAINTNVWVIILNVNNSIIQLKYKDFRTELEQQNPSTGYLKKPYLIYKEGEKNEK